MYHGGHNPGGLFAEVYDHTQPAAGKAGEDGLDDRGVVELLLADSSCCAQPSETLSHPVTGFQVASVHSIALVSAKVLRRFD